MNDELLKAILKELEIIRERNFFWMRMQLSIMKRTASTNLVLERQLKNEPEIIALFNDELEAIALVEEFLEIK